MFDDLFAENNDSYQMDSTPETPQSEAGQPASPQSSPEPAQSYSFDTQPAASEYSYAENNYNSTPIKETGFPNKGTSNYTIGDYKRHARSDLDWKRLSISAIACLAASFIFTTLSELAEYFLYGKLQDAVPSIIAIISLFVLSGLSAGFINACLEKKRNSGNTGAFGKFDRMLPMAGTAILVALIIMAPSLISIMAFVYAILC